MSGRRNSLQAEYDGAFRSARRNSQQNQNEDGFRGRRGSESEPDGFKIREIYGEKSPQMEYARKSLEALWEGLQILADTKGDAINHDLVTIEEWITILKKSNSKDKTGPKWFTDYMKFMFKLFNVSEGGWDLNINEYSDGMAVYGHGLEEAHAAFHKFAIDKDGKQKDYISFEEWKQLFSDLFFSSNEKDLGNYLFGDLNAKCHTLQRNYCATRPMTSEAS
uniref:EF-hand domain-containing protein n=1 Tax=Panagrolaimus davidi TaxID=227884 RepID=A0A914PTQ6_9BILA